MKRHEPRNAPRRHGTHGVRRAALAGAALVLSALACGGGQDAPAGNAAQGPGAAQAPGGGAAPPASAGPATIDVVKVVEQPLEVQLSLPGEITAFQSVAIYPRVNGFVKTVQVDRGSQVRTGQLLATLEAPELVAQRSEAQSKLQSAEAQLAGAQAKADADRSTYERLKAAAMTPGVVAGNDVLVSEKSADASRNVVNAATQNVEAARHAADAVRELEGYLRVTAPFSGVITERNVHPGALVGPAGGPGTAPMLRLIDNNRLRIVVPVPEAYTAEVTGGTEVPFTVAAYPGQTWTGTVARIARSVDVSSRTMAVELDVANTDGRLAPGTFCQVRWSVRRSGPSLFVPSGSVASTTDRTFVIRVRGGKTEWVNVRTGLTAGPLVEVFGELAAGDEIAGRGTDELRPGTEVRARQPKPAA
jgi:membrane fusion protein (multidrug efflux system)